MAIHGRKAEGRKRRLVAGSARCSTWRSQVDNVDRGSLNVYRLFAKISWHVDCTPSVALKGQFMIAYEGHEASLHVSCDPDNCGFRKRAPFDG